MPHPGPEDLALLALGEPVEGAEHLETCAVCAAEVASLRRVVLVGRASSLADSPALNPPPGVWARVQAELGLGAESAAGPAGAPVVAIDGARGARRGRGPGRLALAAAAGVAVGLFGGALLADRMPDRPQGTVVADALLESLPGWAATGRAEVRERDGSRVVVVNLEAEAAREGFREVWLIAADLSGMVSLGLLEGGSGEFVVPAGVDLTRFPVVDVSQEPSDGDAAHSGDSIVRGSLET